MLFRGRWLILVSKVNGTNGFQASARIEEAQSRLKQIARATATLEREFKTPFAMLGQTRALSFYRLPLDSLGTERKKWRFFYGFSTTNQIRDRPVISLSDSIPTDFAAPGFNSFSTIQLRFFLFIYFFPPPPLFFLRRFLQPLSSPWLLFIFSFYAFFFLITIALFTFANK